MIEIQAQQILLPKKVYIGDTAELRCSFSSNSLSLKNFLNGNIAVLSENGFTSELDLKSYNIQKIQLMPAGVDYYQLSITFVPWKTGNIQFPSYNISANFHKESELAIDDEIIINFNKVNIVSLIEQNSITSLRSSSAPLLLPNTTYKLYGGILGFVVFIILMINLIAKRNELAFFVKNQRLIRKYKKNRRQTEKKLSKLLNNSQLTDKDFCQEYQKIIRFYLEARFCYPFTKTVTSQIMKGFTKAFGGTDDFTSLISAEKEDAACSITGFFTRTDFIRYSKDGKFNENEKTELIAATKEAISVLESVEKSDNQENMNSEKKEDSNV